jgi:hypothetical protein
VCTDETKWRHIPEDHDLDSHRYDNQVSEFVLFGMKADWISLVSEWAVLWRRIINPETWNGINCG